MSVYLTYRSELIKVTVKMFDLREISVLLNYFCWHYRTGGRFEPRQREPVKNLVTYPLILRQTFTASYFTRKYVIYFRTNWINQQGRYLHMLFILMQQWVFLLLFVCLFVQSFVCLFDQFFWVHSFVYQFVCWGLIFVRLGFILICTTLTFVQYCWLFRLTVAIQIYF